MKLTLGQLASAEDRAQKSWIERPHAEWAGDFILALIEAAREQTAREACEDLLPEGWCLTLDRNETGTYEVIATQTSMNGNVRWDEYRIPGATPTAAYLALLERLGRNNEV